MWGLAPEDGVSRIMNALADPEQPLVIAARCVGLIRALAQVKPAANRSEIYDIDHEIYSHHTRDKQQTWVTGATCTGDSRPRLARVLSILLFDERPGR